MSCKLWVCNWRILLAGAVLLGAACTKNKKENAQIGQGFRDGEIIVQADNIDLVLAEAPGLRANELYPEANLYTVSGQSIAGNEFEFSESLQKKGLVKNAEPNYIRGVAAGEAVARPRDAYWLDLWGLSNIGQDAPNGSEGKEGADIGVLKAWETTKGSAEIVVAVMDTGIDYGHEDLKDNMYVNKAEFGGKKDVDDDPDNEKVCVDPAKTKCYVDDVYGWNFVSSNEEELAHGVLGTPDPMDGHGHGTHVAGTIGAVANNVVGIVGINQKVRLMALKVLNDEGSGDEADIIRAVRYAALKKVDVVNASFGGGGESKNFKAALKAAEKAGVLFVAAAGNKTANTDESENFPSNYDVDNVISVAATDNRDQLAEFSNYGYKTVDIAAPGVNVRSTYPTKLAKDEGTPNDPYRVFSGTSMATPHVVGAAALTLAARGDLRHKPSELKRVLMESVDWQPQLAGRVRSGGRLNVAKAVDPRGQVPIFSEKNWETINYAYSSPSTPASVVDEQKVIKVEGAKAIQVHIAKNMMDSLDLAAVYDGALRLVSLLPGDINFEADAESDYWTPIVYGDTVTLRFANSVVQLKTVKETKRNLSESESNKLAGEVMCYPAKSPPDKSKDYYDCTIWNDPTDPFGNNRSEGFVVDKVRVLKS